jgi:biopolymer transport protein ExbD
MSNHEDESSGFGLPNLTQMIEVLLVVIFTLLVSLGDDTRVIRPQLGNQEASAPERPTPTLSLKLIANGSIEAEGKTVSLQEVIKRIHGMANLPGAVLEIDMDHSVKWESQAPLFYEAMKAKMALVMPYDVRPQP